MIRRGASLVLCAVMLSALGAVTAAAGPSSDDGQHDIGALLDEARQSFDLDAEDAVILLQQERQLWTADQRRVHELHRIVWIATARAIRSYADLRVPWNATQQTLRVDTLRSWRPSDRRFTASGPTGVVETTPYAFGRAVDYTGIRETMLLTDGVELPCVLELRYVIEDREAFAGGSDGVVAMAQDDPCLISELVLGAPDGGGLQVATSGVELAETSRDETLGLELRTYRARDLQPLPWPHPAATEVMHVAWSSWPDRDALGRELAARFDATATLDEASRAAAAEAVRGARSEIERAEQLAAWVAEATSYVDYDRQWFPTPRPAHRSWATAYANALDRAVLAAAAMRDAGLRASLAYRRPRGVMLPEGVATLAPFEGPLLWVAGRDFEALYDPASSTLEVAAPACRDGSLWRLAVPADAAVHAIADRALLRFDLKWDAESTGWQGTGMLQADGILSPFTHMQGLEAGRSEKVLGVVVDAVLGGAEITGHNFERFAPEAVHAGFTIAVPAGERDAQGRLRLDVGDPAPSLNDPLHAVGSLYEATRGSAVHLAAPLELVVEIHLTTADLETVALPAVIDHNAAVGSFNVEVVDGDEIVVRRSLRIVDSELSGAEWPELRSLLLANASPRYRTVLLR